MIMERYAKPCHCQDASGTEVFYLPAVKAVSMLFIAALVLAGCAATPDWDLEDVDEAVTPAVAQAEGADLAGVQVRWAGVIVAIENLDRATQLVVLTYPVDRRGRPELRKDAYGRVLVEYDAFLEPVVYAPGRSISILGRLEAPRAIRVGEAEREVPFVAAESLHLWEIQRPASQPRVHFGVGVGIIR